MIPPEKRLTSSVALTLTNLTVLTGFQTMHKNENLHYKKSTRKNNAIKAAYQTTTKYRLSTEEG